MNDASRINANIVQARFLADLVLIQMNTAPIDLTIGATIDGSVRCGYITVKTAPGAVLEKIVELAGKYGLLTSLRVGGLLVGFDRANELRQEEFFSIWKK